MSHYKNRPLMLSIAVLLKAPHIVAAEITTQKPPAVKVKTASTSTPAQESTCLEEIAVTAITIQNGHQSADGETNRCF
jgi:hypothetical protein